MSTKIAMSLMLIFIQIHIGWTRSPQKLDTLTFVTNFETIELELHPAITPHGKYHVFFDSYYYGIANYKHGLRHGKTFRFYEDKTVRLEATYKKDKLHGLLKEYRPDGSLMKITKYKNNQTIGEPTLFTPNGKKTIRD